jgi:hypothetical protein
MIRESLTEKHIELSCDGDEGTPKRNRGISCAFPIEGNITLKYKDVQPKTPSGVDHKQNHD